MNLTSVALFCGSAAGNHPQYIDLAKQFGKKCAELKLTLYYGGASIGLMGAASGEMIQNGGKVVGVAPSFFADGTVLDRTLEHLILVDSMSKRKQLMEEKSDAFVILPGSYGTMDEFFEVITDAQLGLHFKPIALLNAFGYYDHLIAQLQKFKEEGFLKQCHFDLLIIAETIAEMFEKLQTYQNSNDRYWLDKIKCDISKSSNETGA